MDLSTFSLKYAADLRGTQVGTAMYGIYAPGVNLANPSYGAAWNDAGVIIPWTAWIQSGDRRIVDENWDGMEKYLAEIASKNPNRLWQNGFGVPFGSTKSRTLFKKCTSELTASLERWIITPVFLRRPYIRTRAVETRTESSRHKGILGL
jgi:Bacterial alpha-L-rhamnosidase 6 hairpin glycosidase domain